MTNLQVRPELTEVERVKWCRVPGPSRRQPEQIAKDVAARILEHERRRDALVQWAAAAIAVAAVVGTFLWLGVWR